MATLPEDFKNHFSSMRELYGELSADLHAATGSSELFDAAKNKPMSDLRIDPSFYLAADTAPESESPCFDRLVSFGNGRN